MRKVLALAAVAAALLSVSAAGGAGSTYDPFFAAPVTIADFGSATADNRAYGVATGDFDGDGKADVIAGRVSGRLAFLKGNGDGTFGAAATFAWKQTTFNAWPLTAADVNGDGKLDVVWGSNALSTGCSISPIPSGQTCATAGGTTQTVNDGDVRAFLGNGDGTFQEATYFVSGVRHNAGVLLARPGTADAASVAAGDIDGDSDTDFVVGAIDGTNAAVKVLRNGGGTFTVENLIGQTQGCSTTATVTCSPAYFPPTSGAMTVSPWGLALGDADGDGDRDLFVGDRALYVYLYLNNGSGSFSLKAPNGAVSGRPNVYLGHDSFRASVGFSASLTAGDVNGDGKADLALGLQSGGQTSPSSTAHDGEILLDVSDATGHSGFGPVADIGAVARGITLFDANGDGLRDLVGGELDGKVRYVRQLPPLDSDADGISEYVDNAPSVANAARLDMNTDGSVNYRDQLDNDFDTVLGNPEDQSTWQRLGDVADPDDDNDGLIDVSDNCPFTANSSQDDVDTDGIGNVCDPYTLLDADGDGVARGPLAGDPGYGAARDAAILWSQGDTHFVIRIDALGRFFQNEFTQLMTDAASLSPAEWAAKCWENYDPGDVSATYEPCGDDATKTLTLPGGKSVPVTLVVIPKQLWTDPPVIGWINDRNNSPLFELGQHGTYHVNNVPVSDWKSLADRNFFSCEPCGLTEAENYELMKVGYDTLLGNYGNKWVAESGASAGSPKIDWSSSAHALESYAPPFNTSDTTARKAIAQLGFKAFSASTFEEDGFYGPVFSPEGGHHEQFDQFGMFHASADLEFEPPEPTSNGTYDQAAYAEYLAGNTQDGQLNTWLIEEVEWSGRPCNDDPRLTNTGGDAPATCSEAGGATSNRENNTVYSARWNGWMQLLDYVRSYPDGVVMTMGDVALAKAYDNAPTVANPSQADSDHDGVGDVIDGAALTVPADSTLSRNVAGTLSATLRNGAAQPIAGQTITFSFDGDGDGTAETATATTNASGVAEVTVTATRPVGPAGYDVSWDGLRATAAASGSVNVADATSLTLAASNPSTGQVTDALAVSATLTDSDGAPLAGRTVSFTLGTASASDMTDADGVASVTLTIPAPAGPATLSASFAGVDAYGQSSATAPFTIEKEDTAIALADVVAKGQGNGIASATLKEADGAPLVGRTITWLVEEKVKNQLTMVVVGTSTTDNAGVATFTYAARYLSRTKRPIRASFAGDASFLASEANAFAYRP